MPLLITGRRLMQLVRTNVSCRLATGIDMFISWLSCRQLG